LQQSEFLTFGRELISQLNAGYTDDEIGKHGLLDSDLNFLHKPFPPEQLLLRIRDILDRRSPML
jgi:DNA-binding response OmpR family regulator